MIGPRFFACLITSAFAGAGLHCAEPPDDVTVEETASALTEAELIASLRARLPSDEALTYTRGGPSLIDGFTFSQYAQSKAGLSVEGGGVTIRMRDGAIVSYRKTIHKLWGFSTTPAIALPDAIRLAKSAFKREAFPSGGTVQYAAGSPACTLVIGRRLTLPPAQPSRGPPPPVPPQQLQYRCAVESIAPQRKQYSVGVNGERAEILWAMSMNKDAPAEAHASMYLENLGPLTFVAEAHTSSCTLESARVRTRNMQNTLNEQQFSGAIEYGGTLEVDGSCTFGLAAEEGVLAHWAAGRAVEQYDRVIGAEHLDFFPGGKVIIHLDTAGAPNQLAHFDGAGNVFVFMSPPEVRTIGHELGHAFLDGMGYSGQHYSGEYGAMSEGWAELWAAYTRATYASYTTFNQLLNEMPDVPGAQGWTDPLDLTIDRGGVHNNAPILNKAVLRAAHGGNGVNSLGVNYDVEAIGGFTAMNLVNAAIIEGINPGDGFAPLADASEQIAVDVCGEHSAAAQSIHNAWYSVDIALNEMPLPYFTPARNAMNVPPWALRLSWEDAGDGPWVVELRETTLPQLDGFTQLWDPLYPNITPVQQPVGGWIVSATDVENSQSVGFVETKLRPGATFEWRVRSQAANPNLNCWRPRGWFTTGDAVPIPVSPLGAQAHHPWRLQFAMQLAAGTDRVEIEVARDASMRDLVFPAKMFDVDPTGTEPDVSVELTVPKRSDLYWRVRAHANGAGSSAWSQPVPFVTGTPRVTLSTPAHQAPVHPWNLELKWQELYGSARYDVDIDPSSQTSLDYDGAVPGDRTSIIRSFPAHSSAPNSYNWKVIATGPPLGSVEQPERADTAEQSELHTQRTFTLDKEATRVQIVAPIYDPVVKGCLGFNDLLVQWAGIPGAEAFRINIYAVYSNFMLPPFDWVGTTLRYSTTIDAPRISTWIDDTAVLYPSPNEVDLVGYQVVMQAIGPGGTSGIEGYTSSDIGRYYLRPSVPVSIDPTNVQVNWSEDVMRMVWAVDYAPEGYFELETFYGPGCSGSANGAVYFGNHYGATAAETPPRPEGSTGSWRVRPWYDGHCSFSNAAWSACTNYTIPTGPVQTGGCGSTFSSVAGGFDDGGSFQAVFPAVNTHAAIVFNTLNIPDRIVVRSGSLILKDTECVSTNNGCPTGCSGSGGTCWCDFWSGLQNDTVDIELSTACNAINQTNTLWEFQVVCFDDGANVVLNPGPE